MLKDIDRDATNALNNHKKLYVHWGTDKSMSQAQRGALHVWCDQVAKVLNESGLLLIRKSFFSDKEIELDWDKDLVKSHIYKPMLMALTDKKSTEKQTTVDPSNVSEHIARHFSNNGVVLPYWPSRN